MSIADWKDIDFDTWIPVHVSQHERGYLVGIQFIHSQSIQVLVDYVDGTRSRQRRWFDVDVVIFPENPDLNTVDDNVS